MESAFKPPAWFTLGAQHVWRPYTQMKTATPALPVVAAQGTRLRLADGRELIDGVGAWWTVVHGYRHPHIEAAVEDQLRRLPHVMFGGLAHEPGYTLAARLAALLPGDLEHAFFSDSGSVAVEVAMKMAAQFWLNQGVRGRTRFLAFQGGYHGDTFATMAVCDPEEGMHSLFRGIVREEPVIALPVTDEDFTAFDAWLAREGHTIAAVLLEPLVQGAGGMRMHAPGTVRRITELARRHGILVIYDEIFVGFGRLGSLFAMQQAGIVPDIVCLGKALTGGFLPLAVTVATKRVFHAFLDDSPSKALMHGPTFMGNALACAAANASLDLFEREPRLAQVKQIEAWLSTGLEAARGAPNVADVRVRGALGVIQLHRMPPLALLERQFAEAGVFLRPFGNILYTTPLYISGEEEIARLTRALVCAALTPS
ncbi:MAG: adenosylmethionine--8-amino-7-oxononanoate transaminase [Polyangiaceae bacterium]